MYVCPTCSKRFEDENKFTKHFSFCWKKYNPNHKSKDAPRSADIEVKNVNDEIKMFFEKREI